VVERNICFDDFFKEKFCCAANAFHFPGIHLIMLAPLWGYGGDHAPSDKYINMSSPKKVKKI
jgi:hypothetical protein